MVASQRLIDERQRCLVGFEEEGIVVAADKTVEGSKFDRGETVCIPGRNVVILFVRNISLLKLLSKQCRSANLQCSLLCQAGAAQKADWGFCQIGPSIPNTHWLQLGRCCPWWCCWWWWRRNDDTVVRISHFSRAESRFRLPEKAVGERCTDCVFDLP